jgi:hypothetical protein
MKEIMSVVAVPASLDEIAQTMTEKINLVIMDIEEISKTKPTVKLRLVQNKTDGLVIEAEISFANSHHLSPMEFAEQLIATDLIKVVVNNHFAR